MKKKIGEELMKTNEMGIKLSLQKILYFHEWVRERELLSFPTKWDWKCRPGGRVKTGRQNLRPNRRVQSSNLNRGATVRKTILKKRRHMCGQKCKEVGCPTPEPLPTTRVMVLKTN